MALQALFNGTLSPSRPAVDAVPNHLNFLQLNLKQIMSWGYEGPAQDGGNDVLTVIFQGSFSLSPKISINTLLDRRIGRNKDSRMSFENTTQWGLGEIRINRLAWTSLRDPCVYMKMTKV